jgi:hypothetical protein
VPECGDGYLNSIAGEQCDDGNGLNKDACPDGFDGTCKPAFCGDGHVRHLGPHPEECDRGPANSNTKPDGCRTNCRTAYCGDGVKDTGEQCDGPGSCSTPDRRCGINCICSRLTPDPLHGDASRLQPRRDPPRIRARAAMASARPAPPGARASSHGSAIVGAPGVDRRLRRQRAAASR